MVVVVVIFLTLISVATILVIFYLPLFLGVLIVVRLVLIFLCVLLELKGCGDELVISIRLVLSLTRRALCRIGKIGLQKLLLYFFHVNVTSVRLIHKLLKSHHGVRIHMLKIALMLEHLI